MPSGYRAAGERVMVIRVEAFDWNCKQHITPDIRRRSGVIDGGQAEKRRRRSLKRSW
ncbi:MAG: hypothetical protein SFV54_11615 [Bryobacteraceae bacterium]|nr:hypothetical protein [Bryobacteraceae bacterium]